MGMPKPLEKDVLAACLTWLRCRGAFVWRQNQGAMSGEYNGKRRFFRFASEPGISDIVGLVPSGRMIAVECKRTGGGKLSLEQASFLERVRKLGGFACVAHSLVELETAAALEGLFDT